ncbi:aspartate dehydrogenase [Paenibacillus abyssi]|uniref:L-aspartate dehydrogenase n=1 Tax=Paenibacillus abyssi TaxID=1340531 RepID=A0A917CQ87_9BACL|nr:aspartate dehydrogenase [Paenibacillus abyssi]GGF94718.1 L-aspartate dehydrogenase [Paenibacillus abyssi]
MLKVGIIGYGTIGEDVAEAIGQGKAGAAEVTSILVRDKSKYKESDPYGYAMTEDQVQFFSQRPDIVVECAGHEAVRKYGELTLVNGADLLVVSVGAFADELLLNRMMEVAGECQRKIIVPSAAIGGLDRIAAGSVGDMDEVTLITRKPPQAWYGTFVEQQVDLAALKEPYTAFEGVARDSARLFPESVNVSAALSLAGVGFDETKVKVIVDPTVTHNTHEIAASGKFGRIQLQIQNTPSARNPKTGYIVAMSVIKTLRERTSSFIIGL